MEVLPSAIKTKPKRSFLLTVFYRTFSEINKHDRVHNMQKIVAKFYSQKWLPDEDWKLNHDGGKGLLG